MGRPETAAAQKLAIILMSLVVHQAVQMKQDVPAVRRLFRMAAAVLVDDVNLVVTHLLQTGVPSTQPAMATAVKTEQSLLVILDAAVPDARLQALIIPVVTGLIGYGVAIVIAIIVVVWLTSDIIVQIIPLITVASALVALLYLNIVSAQALEEHFQMAELHHITVHYMIAGIKSLNTKQKAALFGTAFSFCFAYSALSAGFSSAGIISGSSPIAFLRLSLFTNLIDLWASHFFLPSSRWKICL